MLFYYFGQGFYYRFNSFTSANKSKSKQSAAVFPACGKDNIFFVDAPKVRNAVFDPDNFGGGNIKNSGQEFNGQ